MYSYVDFENGFVLTTSTIKPREGHRFFCNGTMYVLDHIVNNVAYYNREKLNPTIENNFKYHSPNDDQPEKYTALREKAKELAYLIDELCPQSREKSVAFTELETAMFWANASIARN